MVYIPLHVTRRQSHIAQSQSVFSSAKCHMLCKSGLLSGIVQSRHSVCFVIVGVNEFVTVIVLVKNRRQSRIK